MSELEAVLPRGNKVLETPPVCSQPSPLLITHSSARILILAFSDIQLHAMSSYDRQHCHYPTPCLRVTHSLTDVVRYICTQSALDCNCHTHQFWQFRLFCAQILYTDTYCVHRGCSSRVVSRIFVPKRGEVKGQLIRLHNDLLYDMY